MDVAAGGDVLLPLTAGGKPWLSQPTPAAGYDARIQASSVDG
jgi:hypothetical protein